jgi:hypothetical protein
MKRRYYRSSRGGLLGTALLEAARGLNTRVALEVRHQAYYNGLHYAVAPDGTVHSVTSSRGVAELAKAYRDYLR